MPLQSTLPQNRVKVFPNANGYHRHRDYSGFPLGRRGHGFVSIFEEIKQELGAFHNGGVVCDCVSRSGVRAWLSLADQPDPSFERNNTYVSDPCKRASISPLPLCRCFSSIALYHPEHGKTDTKFSH